MSSPIRRGRYEVVSDQSSPSTLRSRSIRTTSSSGERDRASWAGGGAGTVSCRSTSLVTRSPRADSSSWRPVRREARDSSLLGRAMNVPRPLVRVTVSSCSSWPRACRTTVRETPKISHSLSSPGSRSSGCRAPDATPDAITCCSCSCMGREDPREISECLRLSMMPVRSRRRLTGGLDDDVESVGIPASSCRARPWSAWEVS